MKTCSDSRGQGASRAARRWLPLLAALSLISAGLPAWAECKLRSMEIPVRLVNHRPIATVEVNGVALPMLVDSGAFYSFLQASTAAELQLPLRELPGDLRLEGYTGRIEAKRTKVDKIKIQSAEIPNVEFIVGGNELGSGIRGILGRNLLAAGDTEYDLARGVIRLVFPLGECRDTNLAYWAGDAPVISEDLHRRDGAIRVPVRVNGRKLIAMLDTGAPGTALKMRAARRAGIDDKEMEMVGLVGGAGDGRVRSWTANVTAFELGGEKIANNRFAIDETSKGDDDMLIGLDYFLSHRIYVSRGQNKLYATWNGGPVFARAGQEGVYDQSHAAVPADVAPENANGFAARAAAAVTRGDHAAALKDLDRACELAPTDAHHFHARARVKLALRQPREALADFDEALRLQPTLAEAQMDRAGFRFATKNRAGAEADLQALDAALSPSAPLRMNMASLYAELNLAPEAFRQWELWLPTRRSDARFSHVLNQRCWLRARLNIELPKALEDCKLAIDKDGAEPSYRDSLGWTYLRLGEAANARKAFDAAIERQPIAWAHFGRAIALQRLGNPEAAQRDLEAARKLDPKIEDGVRKAGFGALLSESPI